LFTFNTFKLNFHFNLDTIAYQYIYKKTKMLGFNWDMYMTYTGTDRINAILEESTCSIVIYSLIFLLYTSIKINKQTTSNNNSFNQTNIL